ncbi:DNA-binding transcriptional regulator Fis [Nitrincola tapanii]|uniref:Putative Fis-like DNA-binding protein n=1 Tax=Nitrincola tapanii TaxID=1708751 RepID=A0A5A9VZV4_9GAMM|nr:DNA-binding transcriptional regulator Fis [Nitrincola tapanii]KAA0873842.1 DNA-binding transcriptional regulator Fis [Nitrincola tapanii]
MDNKLVKHTHTAQPTTPPQTLRDSVHHSMTSYFKQLDGQPVTDVYQMVLAEIEAPLFETVMAYTKDNQTKASELLGLNRGTLRKKLKQYGLL